MPSEDQQWRDGTCNQRELPAFDKGLGTARNHAAEFAEHQTCKEDPSPLVKWTLATLASGVREMGLFRRSLAVYIL